MKYNQYGPEYSSREYTNGGEEQTHLIQASIFYTPFQ